MIHNAGINCVQPFEQLAAADLLKVMEVNCFGPILLTQALFADYKIRGPVVFVVSEASWKPMRFSLPYNISKAALAMAVRQMGRELTKVHGVPIVGVCPGFIQGTEMTRYVIDKTHDVRGWSEEDFMEYWKNSSNSGVPHSVESLARQILAIAETAHLSNSGAMMNLVD